MTLKSTLATFLLLLLLSSVAYFSLFTSHLPLPVIINNTDAPDAYMEHVNAFIMDKDGNLNMKIFAPKLIHFNKDDISDLTSPQITIYRQSPMPWLISARFAKASQGIDKVKFRDDVIIRHATDVDAPETVIKTTTLLVRPNAKTAETIDSITMLQPNLTVKSIGMFADMNSGDIKLLSQPRGVYVPSS